MAIKEIEIPASVTYSKYIVTKKYKWKSKKKSSKYFTNEKRVVLRIASSEFSNKLKNLSSEQRQIKISFLKYKDWIVKINRVSKPKITLTYNPLTKENPHAWAQAIVNKAFPKELEKIFQSDIKNRNEYSITKQIKVRIDLTEWDDIKLKPWEFLYHTEVLAKELMRYSINRGFGVYFVPKGREYDLQLIAQNKVKFAIAILTHEAKSKSRSKQHRINKALLDIAKMLPSLNEDKSLVPVVIMQPFNFKGSWSFTTDDYLKFYGNHFNFQFIFTNFNKEWTRVVCQRLKNIALQIRGDENL